MLGGIARTSLLGQDHLELLRGDNGLGLQRFHLRVPPAILDVRLVALPLQLGAELMRKNLRKDAPELEKVETTEVSPQVVAKKN